MAGLVVGTNLAHVSDQFVAGKPEHSIAGSLERIRDPRRHKVWIQPKPESHCPQLVCRWRNVGSRVVEHRHVAVLKRDVMEPAKHLRCLLFEERNKHRVIVPRIVLHRQQHAQQPVEEELMVHGAAFVVPAIGHNLRPQFGPDKFGGSAKPRPVPEIKRGC